MRTRFCTLLLVMVIGILGALLLTPTPAQPVRWTPPEAPTRDGGVYARNTILQDVARVGAANIAGPEALLVDDDQFLITGLHDGRVIRSSLDGKHVTVLTHTHGRPLGLALHPDGRLIIADAVHGLLALDQDGTLTVLTTQANSVPFGFTDDVTVDQAGRYAYFSDASSRWGYGQDAEAVMEHGGDGRLLRYDFETDTTEVLADGLEFANGVALAPDEAWVLVNETGAYRISRYWLKGEKAGTRDVFIDNLPGLPDNIRFNGQDRYWVALYAPRNPLLDGLAEHPFLRKMLIRALKVIPKPVEHYAFALGLNTNGEVIANLQDGSRGNYSPITTVHEHDQWLYFGSLTQTSLARLPLDAALKPK